MSADTTPSLQDLDPEDGTPGYETIEERCFSAALICLEGHYTIPPMGPQTATRVSSMIAKTLEKTHTFKHVRETLSRNVEIWIWLTKIFGAAIPSLTTRSVGPLSSLNDPEKGVTPQESTALIVKNHHSLKDDLSILNKLMHIARNLLVTSEPEVPQDICAAVHFDQMVYQTIILCVNVTSKGYDGEILDETSRAKLNEITDMYKKLLVTSLQQAHNWTAKNDRNKMSFWYDVLFDEDAQIDESQDGLGDSSGFGFQVDVAKTEIQHWLERNSRMCDAARKLLKDYSQNKSHKPPGVLAPIAPLAWNWYPEGQVKVRADNYKEGERVVPVWDLKIRDKFEQDRVYCRVSREIDTWWLRARDANYEGWVVAMPSVDFAKQRTEHCKNNLLNRYTPVPVMRTTEESEVVEVEESEQDLPEGEPEEYAEGYDQMDNLDDNLDDMMDDEDIDDDESYGEGPLTGLLTEIPNILDPKQIEALHMIVKSCILDSAGTGLTRAGENLQKTRCRMFLALDCGKSLLREMLVFIAVWEKDEQSLIFQITSQLIEALHHSALVPYAWNSLRIPKDIISPAQTVLLRLVNHIFRSRISNPPQDKKDQERDVKLVMFFFSFFRSRIVPECVALMHLQAQIREDNIDPAEFPVDTWDMERAKDGLAQYLDFLTTASEITESRKKLIEWEAVYDLITLLNGLEAGVPKKPLVDAVPSRSRPAAPADQQSQNPNSTTPIVERPYSTSESLPPSPPPPSLSDPAHKYPWSGIKGQIFTILATLLQPPPGQSSPGNAEVQNQMVAHNGIVPLLNCCAYDDHNPFAKERVTICLKWLLDGCEAANNFFRELVNLAPPPNMRPPPGGTTVSTIRVDGIQGEVKVQVRSKSAPAGDEAGESAGAGGSGARPMRDFDDDEDYYNDDDPFGLEKSASKLNLSDDGKAAGSSFPFVSGEFTEDDFM
ncbi:essential cytoplasmic protein [Colletotrichum musicola]|uniref:Ataxin-10 homolog n=1 Tax=Colletotrichum musicola TaxID=2175873 RepID=A0A8H6NUW2_9PEZI|nr:essential cytoplasmic protein [Colletotrichum musicola]